MERKGKEVDVEVFPRRPDELKHPDEEVVKEYDKPMLGIGWDSGGERWLASDTPMRMIIDSGKSIYNTLSKVLSPKSGISGGHLSGPAGIMGLYYDLFQERNGWRKVIWFSVVLNVNLAILNLLPFPVLDGGHIVMAIAEWIRRKPVPLKLLEVVQTGFVLLLFGFMGYITLKDIGDRLPGKKSEFVLKWNPPADS